MTPEGPATPKHTGPPQGALLVPSAQLSPPPTLSLKLLGPPSVSFEGEPVRLSPGATTLCAYLALAPPEGRPRSVAAAHLFEDCSERLARRRLNTALWRLRCEVRSGTGLEIVACDSWRTVALSPDVGVATDAARFQGLVESVLRVPPADLDEADVARLHSAVLLRRGRLVETCDDHWVMTARCRIDTLYLAALDHLIQHYGARRDVPAITTYGERALELEPLREDLHRHLIRAYGTAGRLDLAERQFERCRAVLLEELGVDPMPETVATYARLHTGGSSRSRAVAALITEFERARRDVGRLATAMDRALDQLRGMS
ncbi:bacterial transcriptional activator domain-containing protein [Streptomyces sp. NBC_00287]|uniref:AfsR/SARP family transcriptional regulator n=1 Tax=Streptomyces sp. NBC_00287 TaxID=2975702 RepID=UPI002E2D2894|nr:bacterial transcriptional activator domain-containing protein [Streptomyces sp. NBC_00287]